MWLRASLVKESVNVINFFDMRLIYTRSVIMTLGPPRSLGNLEAMQQRRCSQPWQMVLSTTTELFTFTVDVTELPPSTFSL